MTQATNYLRELLGTSQQALDVREYPGGFRPSRHVLVHVYCKPAKPDEHGNLRTIGEPKEVLGNYVLDMELLNDLAECVLNGVPNVDLHFRDPETNS